MYTTIARVRDESGFKNNPNITDNYISGYLTQANGVVNGYIGGLYNISTLTGSLFVNSQAQSLLQRIEELFASGYLLISEFGSQARDTDKDGYVKVKEAERLCFQIIEGSVRLIDINGNEFPKKSTSTSGGPTLTTPTNNPNLDPIFTTNMTF